MSYDPFARGPHPVGVRTEEVHDAARGRRLPVEVWYPADALHAGQDLSDEHRDRYQMIPALPPVTQDAVRGAQPERGRFPLVIFSHGLAGHRRQSTFYCTHLASHGYVVAAMDHVGNTTLDLLPLMAGAGSSPPDPHLLTGAAVQYRPSDVSLVLDAMLAGEDAGRIDAKLVGMTGHSFGGWTTLASTRRDPRIRASVALAPAGGSLLSGENPFAGTLDFEWEHEVPTLYLVAERDSLLPVAGMRELYEQTKSPKRFAVLGNADHQHFCDQAEQIHEFMRMMLAAAPAAYGTAIAQMRPIGELCPGEHGYLCARGLGLAHFDAHLKQSSEAVTFLERDARSALAALGVDVEIT